MSGKLPREWEAETFVHGNPSAIRDLDQSLVETEDVLRVLNLHPDLAEVLWLIGEGRRRFVVSPAMLARRSSAVDALRTMDKSSARLFARLCAVAVEPRA